jgi:glycosyltransferase involved in cell wall biosynthesis
MNKKRILVIGPVWPEPASSAAGTRMIQLIGLFIIEGYEVHFASAASKSDFSFDLKGLGVQEHEIKLNDNSFNVFLSELNPDIVLFDRFMMEEQYGWRVQQECPDAIRLMDTEDLHCLRFARQQAIKTGGAIDLYTDIAKREIASVLRCDISLIISEVEMNILQKQFRIDPSLIYYLPFLEEELTAKDIQHWQTFEEREGFVFIGNYLHEPNWDTLQILKTKIWPVLRKKLPAAKLNIYGAYSSQKVMQLHNEKEKFYVHGRADDALEVIANNRILLAPIQFGAGMKGKLIDAMRTGTPSVTTSVGAEAMKGNLDWNGAIEDNFELFADQAAKLYQDKKWWSQSQQNGAQLINQRYGKSQFTKAFIETVNALFLNLAVHRQDNFFWQILMHHTANSTKYMSLWIEEKNAKKDCIHS